MATPVFSDILNRQATDIERPKPIPIGTYLWIVKGQPRLDKSAKKQTPFAEYTLQAVQAQEDVDEEDLAAFLSRKDGSKKVLSDISTKATFYLTEDAAWRLNKFLEDCGLDLEGSTLQALLPEAVNCQVLGVIRHQPSEDGQSVFAQLGNTAKVD